MLRKHKDVFFRVAQEFTCWIGLREPNPLADRWIEHGGGIPKAEDCKAKTADNPSFRLAGLVVDPTLCPEAFKPQTLGEATKTWKEKFLVGGRLPAGYLSVASGTERGLVKKNGARIFADYDLMLINRTNEQGEFLPTSEAEQKQLFDGVKPALNRGFGLPLIQHGPEFLWRGGVGARESEFVFYFGPSRRFQQSHSSMPKGGH